MLVLSLSTPRLQMEYTATERGMHVTMGVLLVLVFVGGLVLAAAFHRAIAASALDPTFKMLYKVQVTGVRYR